ncbi:hypothetical protein D3C77_436610 [compost metagenome]
MDDKAIFSPRFILRYSLVVLQLFAPQLSAGRIDIGAVLQANAAVNLLLLQHIIEAQNRLFAASLILSVLINRVIWNEVDRNAIPPLAD